MKTLEDARKINKLSQSQLAQLLTVSQVSISNWERGTCLPNPEYQERIEEVLNERIEWNLDAPFDNLEMKAMKAMLEDVYKRTGSFEQTCVFILNKSRKETRFLIRSLGYLVDPLLSPRNPNLEQTMIRRK